VALSWLMYEPRRRSCRRGCRHLIDVNVGVHVVSGGRAVSWPSQTPRTSFTSSLGRSPWRGVVEITADSAAVAGRPTVDGVNFAVLDTRTRVRRQVHFLRPLPHAVDLVGDETLAVTVRVFETATAAQLPVVAQESALIVSEGSASARDGAPVWSAFSRRLHFINNRPWTLPELSLYAPPHCSCRRRTREGGQESVGQPGGSRGQADHFALCHGSGTHRRAGSARSDRLHAIIRSTVV